MQEMTSSSWRRNGSSIVWSPELLGELIAEQDAVPLRTVLGWMTNGFPESPPGDRPTVLVGGLQTVLSTAANSSPEAVYGWRRLLRFVREAVRRAGGVFLSIGGYWKSAGGRFTLKWPAHRSGPAARTAARRARSFPAPL